MIPSRQREQRRNRADRAAENQLSDSAIKLFAGMVKSRLHFCHGVQTVGGAGRIGLFYAPSCTEAGILAIDLPV
jgi:hypothetical protein